MTTPKTNRKATAMAITYVVFIKLLLKAGEKGWFSGNSQRAKSVSKVRQEIRVTVALFLKVYGKAAVFVPNIDYKTSIN
jgi:hypothetical protein